MKCEWHNGFKESSLWVDTIYNLPSWCCDTCAERVGRRDKDGKLMAIPAAEKMKQLHPEQPASCGWDQK